MGIPTSLQQIGGLEDKLKPEASKSATAGFHYASNAALVLAATSSMVTPGASSISRNGLS